MIDSLIKKLLPDLPHQNQQESLNRKNRKGRELLMRKKNMKWIRYLTLESGNEDVTRSVNILYHGKVIRRKKIRGRTRSRYTNASSYYLNFAPVIPPLRTLRVSLPFLFPTPSRTPAIGRVWCKIYSISLLHFFLISAPPFYFLSIPFISIPSSTSYSIYSDGVDQERGGAWNLVTVWHVTFPHNFIAKSRVCNQATCHTVTVTSHTVT